jgi:DNA-binding MarR family transcriptional regulator
MNTFTTSSTVDAQPDDLHDVPQSALDFASHSATHLLHRAGQHAEEMFARASGSLGITARQFVVLAAIDGMERPSQTALCDVSGIDRSTLADIVRRLEMRGLVHRERTKADARMYAVSVTADGTALLQAAAPIAREVEHELLAPFNTEEQQAFKALLRRVIAVDMRSAA